MSSEIEWTNTHRDFTAPISVNKTILFLKYYYFLKLEYSFKIEYCDRYYVLTDIVRTVWFLSLCFPDCFYIAASLWCCRENELPGLTASTIAWKCSAGETGCQLLWFISPLTQQHSWGHWGAWLLLVVTGPLNTESEKGKSTAAAVGGKHDPSKLLWHKCDRQADPCKGKKLA